MNSLEVLSLYSNFRLYSTSLESAHSISFLVFSGFTWVLARVSSSYSWVRRVFSELQHWHSSALPFFQISCKRLMSLVFEYFWLESVFSFLRSGRFTSALAVIFSCLLTLWEPMKVFACWGWAPFAIFSTCRSSCQFLSWAFLITTQCTQYILGSILQAPCLSRLPILGNSWAGCSLSRTHLGQSTFPGDRPKFIQACDTPPSGSCTRFLVRLSWWTWLLFLFSHFLAASTRSLT